MKRTPRRAAVVLALAITPLMGASASAVPLVVRAQGPTVGTLKPGSELSTDKLRLKAGDSVTILDEKGTRTFQGPGTFRLNEESRPRGSEDEMRALLEAQENQRRAVAAATRSKEPQEDSNKTPDQESGPKQ